MKLLLITNDTELKNAFAGDNHFSAVNVETNLPKHPAEDVVIISDRIHDHNEFIAEIGENPSYKRSKMFFMLSNRQDADRITNLLEAKSVAVIPPKMSVRQIVHFVTKYLFPNSLDPIIEPVAVFVGSSARVGTTMTVQACAEEISENSEYRVALLSLNDRPSTSFLKVKAAEEIGIDQIRIKLMNGILTPTELTEAMVKKNNLFILPGPQSIFNLRYYLPEHVDFLIQLARSMFDIILIDAGSNYQSALAFASVRTARTRFMIATQEPSAKEQFDRIRDQVLKPLQITPDDFYLVANKYIKSSPVFSGKQMAEMYEMHLAAAIPDMQYQGLQAEIDRTSLRAYGYIPYNQQIKSLAKLICNQLGKSLEIKEEKRGLFRWRNTP